MIDPPRPIFANIEPMIEAMIEMPPIDSGRRTRSPGNLMDAISITATAVTA